MNEGELKLWDDIVRSQLQHAGEITIVATTKANTVIEERRRFFGVKKARLPNESPKDISGKTPGQRAASAFSKRYGCFEDWDGQSDSWQEAWEEAALEGHRAHFRANEEPITIERTNTPINLSFDFVGMPVSANIDQDKLREMLVDSVEEQLKAQAATLERTANKSAALALRQLRREIDDMPGEKGAFDESPLLDKASVLATVDQALENVDSITDPTKPTKPLSVGNGDGSRNIWYEHLLREHNWLDNPSTRAFFDDAFDAGARTAMEEREADE